MEDDLTFSESAPMDFTGLDSTIKGGGNREFVRSNLQKRMYNLLESEALLDLNQIGYNSLHKSGDLYFSNDNNIPHDLWYLADIGKNLLPEGDGKASPDGTPGEQKDDCTFDTMLNRLGIAAVKIGGKEDSEPRIFPCYFEAVNQSQQTQYSEYIDPERAVEDVVGIYDFRVGTYFSAESLLMVGMVTGNIDYAEGGGEIVPPLEKDLSAERATADSGAIYLAYHRTRPTERAALPLLTEGQEDAAEPAKKFHSVPDFTKNKALARTEGTEDKFANDPFKYVRCFLKKNDKFPTPGEFVGVAARAFRDHAWFFQKTNPFLYSGQWFGTTFYTSGVILEKNPKEDDPEDFTYKVRWHGTSIDLDVETTDYKEHKVGERIGILKNVGSSDKTFDWKQLEENFSEGWRLAPLKFYQ